jgi:hypothetical protein
MSGRDQILVDVSAERERQDKKCGGIPGIERSDDHTYAAVLGEEFGEVCRAWLERDVEALRAELVHTAAVAVAWIEEIENGGSGRASLVETGPEEESRIDYAEAVALIVKTLDFISPAPHAEHFGPFCPVCGLIGDVRRTVEEWKP